MEEDRFKSRVRLLRPGLGIIIADLGLIGAVWLGPSTVSQACGFLALTASVVVVAQAVDAVMSRREPADDCDSAEPPHRRNLRVQFGLGTMLLAVAVAALFLGLGKWNEHYGEISGVPVYSYGFPFYCLHVWHFTGHVSVDSDWLAADVAVAVALGVGIHMEARSSRGRGG